MSILERIVAGAERRNAPAEAYGNMGRGTLGYSFFGASSSSGKAVSVDSALELVPVYSAVQLLAGAIGSLPLKVYSEGDVRTEARSSRQWKILHDQPNDEMAADEFWECVAGHLLLWGNSFLWKERDSNGVVQKLWPIRPSRVTVGRRLLEDNSSFRYFRLDPHTDVILTETDVLHIRGLGTDGIVGLSPIQQARQRLGNQMGMDEFQGSFWKNGAMFSATLQHPNTMSEPAQKRLAEQMAARGGSSRAGEVLVLEEDMKWQTLGMPLRDAQFMEQIQASRQDVAELFGLVPPHRWGSNEKSLTYANTEVADLAFVKWSMRRWLIRIEASLKRDPGLFPAPGPNLHPEFYVDALLRADTKTRYDAYAVGIQAGFLTKQWVTSQENLPDPPAEQTPVAAPALPASAVDTNVGSGDPVASRALMGPHEATLAVPVGVDERTMGLLDELRSVFRPEIRVDAPSVVVNVPQQLPPDVIVNVPETVVNVNVPEQAAPVVNVAAAKVPTVPVQLELMMPADTHETPKKITVKRNPKTGLIESATVEENQ